MEIEILKAIQSIRCDMLDNIMIGITTLGNSGMIWIIISLLFLIIKSKRKIGITIILALILSLVIGNGIIKNVVKRDRPSWDNTEITILIKNPKDYSFPSGHTEASFAAAVAIYLNKKKEGIAALILAGLIAFSRLYLFVHFPSDIVGAMIIGSVLGIIANKIVNKLYDKKIIRL